MDIKRTNRPDPERLVDIEEHERSFMAEWNEELRDSRQRLAWREAYDRWSDMCHTWDLAHLGNVYDYIPYVGYVNTADGRRVANGVMGRFQEGGWAVLDDWTDVADTFTFWRVDPDNGSLAEMVVFACGEHRLYLDHQLFQKRGNHWVVSRDYNVWKNTYCGPTTWPGADGHIRRELGAYCEQFPHLRREELFSNPSPSEVGGDIER